MKDKQTFVGSFVKHFNNRVSSINSAMGPASVGWALVAHALQW
ncbi:hypothetical protein [Wielerella bovis]|nr:hypothetical protein [Wielerella bovis]